MRKMFCGLLFILGVLSGCGGGTSSTTGNNAPSPSAVHVSGVAATGAPVALAQVTLTDATGRTATDTTDAGGNYSIDVTDMAFPMLAKVSYTSASGTLTVLYSYAKTAGTANVNPLTNAAVVACTGTFDGSFDTTAQNAISANLAAKIALLQAKLAQFGAGTDNPVTSSYSIGTGLDAMFDLLDLEVNPATGSIAVKTKFDGSTVASGTLANLAALNVPASAMPTVDNNAINIADLNVNSGEVGSHLVITMTGHNTTDMSKNRIMVGGMWLYGTLTSSGNALDVAVPPGCLGGKVAVLTVNGQGQAVMGYAAESFTVTKQYDYAIAYVLLTPTSIAMSGSFPASGNAIVKIRQGSTVVPVTTPSFSNGLMITIPDPINMLNPFTIEVTSPDGGKVSNVYSYTP